MAEIRKSKQHQNRKQLEMPSLAVAPTILLPGTYLVSNYALLFNRRNGTDLDCFFNCTFTRKGTFFHVP